MKTTGAESRIAIFLAEYSPEIEARLRDARSRLRKHFPRGFELVYDNYNALVFAISPTDRTSDTLISVAGYPKWVTLFFSRGADLDDPAGLLEGSGKRVRGIRLKDAAEIDKPAIRALIRQAALPGKAGFAEAPALTTVVKSVSAKRRPRR